MNEEMQESVIQTMRHRAKVQGDYSLEQQYEFLMGAMKMYLLLCPDSEKDGSWCPPTWFLGIMGGNDFVDEQEVKVR